MTTAISQHTTPRRLLLGAALIAAWWLTAWYLLSYLNGDYLAVVLALAFAYGVIAAHLIRTGWACLIAPLALLLPAFAIVAVGSASLDDWLVRSLFVLLHYNWFIAVPTATGAFVGWASQQPRQRNLA